MKSPQGRGWFRALGDSLLRVVYVVVQPFRHAVVLEQSRCRSCACEWTKHWDVDDPADDCNRCPACGSADFAAIAAHGQGRAGAPSSRRGEAGGARTSPDAG